MASNWRIFSSIVNANPSDGCQFHRLHKFVLVIHPNTHSFRQLLELHVADLATLHEVNT